MGKPERIAGSQQCLSALLVEIGGSVEVAPVGADAAVHQRPTQPEVVAELAVSIHCTTFVVGCAIVLRPASAAPIM